MINKNQTAGSLGLMQPIAYYDPSAKTMKRVSELIKYHIGNPDSFEETITDFIHGLPTTITKENANEEINVLAMEYGTAFNWIRPLWSKLPTIADYEDMDNFYDLEETEKAFLEATKRQGW